MGRGIGLFADDGLAALLGIFIATRGKNGIRSDSHYSLFVPERGQGWTYVRLAWLGVLVVIHFGPLAG